MTTYRRHDRADTGWRGVLKGLGFEERELLTEFGYPTQRFVLQPASRGGRAPLAYGGLQQGKGLPYPAECPESRI